MLTSQSKNYPRLFLEDILQEKTGVEVLESVRVWQEDDNLLCGAAVTIHIPPAASEW